MIEKEEHIKAKSESHDSHSDGEVGPDWSEAEEKALVRK